MLRGIIVFAVVVVFLLAQGPQAWSNAKSLLGFGEWDWWQADPVSAPERAKELADKGLREQLITFDDMESIEYRYSARPETQRYDIYAIGVGQITLNDPESNDRVEKVTVTGSRIPTRPEDMPDASTLPTSPITGRFNNVLIFDRRDGKFSKLFDQRLAISEFQYGWRTTPEVLVIFANDRDTNKDGKLSSVDMQDIYIFTFADKKMHKIDVTGLNPLELMAIPNVDYIVVKARRDRNNDGRAYGGDYPKEDLEPEPTVLVRIDLKTMKASSFVPDDMLENLQRTLDGSKPPSAVVK